MSNFPRWLICRCDVPSQWGLALIWKLTACLFIKFFFFCIWVWCYKQLIGEKMYWKVGCGLSIHACFFFFFFSVDKTSLFLVLWFSWRAYQPIREDQGDFNHSGAYHTVLEVINILNFLTSTCLSSFNFIVEYVCMRNYVFCVYQPHQTVNNLKIKIWNINLTDLLGFLIIACFLCSSLGMYYCISNSIELVIVRG